MMDRLLKKAYQYQNNKQYNEAIELFLQLKENKQYYEIALMETAKSYKMANNPAKAIDYFIELINYNNNEEAIRELSQTACLSKQYDKAEKLLKELFNKTNKNIYAIELIKIYFDKNDMDNINDMVNKKNLDTEILLKTFNDLKKNKSKEKDKTKDIEFYNKQIQLDKNNYLLYLERAKLKRILKDFSGAMSDFNEAINLSIGKDPYVYMERGRLKKEIKDFVGAIEDFKKAIILNNKIYWFFLELARLQEELGDTKKYFFNLNKSLEILNFELNSNSDNNDIQLYIDKLFLQRYLVKSDNIDLTLLKIENLNTDAGIKKYIDSIKSVEKSRQKIAPYRCFFTWDMLHKCNFHCIYCLNNLKTHRALYDLYRSIDEIVDAWKNIYDRYGSSRIRLTGGEPSIYPNFFKLVEKLSGYHRLQLGTNLSFDVDKFCDFANPETVKVDASLHCEYTSLENFVKKLEILKQKNYKLSVSYVAYPTFIKNIAYAKKIIENMNIHFFVHPFFGKFNGKLYPISYTEEEKKQLFELDMKNKFEFEDRKKNNNLEQKTLDKYSNKKTSENLKKEKKELYIKNKENNIYKKCEMGQMYAKILSNGDAYRCCYNDTFLGNLFNKSIKLLDQPEKCYDIDSCSCWRCMIPGEESRWLHTWLDDWETEI